MFVQTFQYKRVSVVRDGATNCSKGGSTAIEWQFEQEKNHQKLGRK